MVSYCLRPKVARLRPRRCSGLRKRSPLSRGRKSFGWVALAELPSSLVWDLAAYHTICARLVQLARDAGSFAELPIYLSAVGFASAWMGDLANATSLVAESESLSEATGSSLSPAAPMFLRSLQGSEAGVLAGLARALKLAAGGGQESAASTAYFTVAILYNGLARYEEAASAARKAASGGFNPWTMWPLPELVEAAVRTGDLQLGHDALGRLTDTTRSCDTGLGGRPRGALPCAAS